MRHIQSDLNHAIQKALDGLDAEPDQLKRARTAHLLTERVKLAMEEFADQRSAALFMLREDDWSLADMKSEFGIARQRLSQIINRETEKARQRERRAGTRRRPAGAGATTRTLP